MREPLTGKIRVPHDTEVSKALNLAVYIQASMCLSRAVIM